MHYIPGTLRPKSFFIELNRCAFYLAGMCTVLLLNLPSSLLILPEVPCMKDVVAPLVGFKLCVDYRDRTEETAAYEILI
jgi:hypothetical protein